MKSIISTRIVNAAINQVYNAYSNPTILIKWWGPHGFTNRFNEFNFKENGLWDFIMIDELGKEYPNQIIYKEILPNKRIVADHINAPLFQIEIDFKEITPLQTEIQFKMNFDDEVVYNALKNYVPEKNEENFDRLERTLLIKQIE